jgi:hypothetical protein
MALEADEPRTRRAAGPWPLMARLAADSAWAGPRLVRAGAALLGHAAGRSELGRERDAAREPDSI